jgi:hypothetical protein
MLKKITVIASLVMCACGSPSEPENNLNGKWYFNLNYYMLGLSFNDNSTYEIDLISPLNTGVIGIEAEVGDYSVQDNQIFFIPEYSSCLTHNHDPETVFYDFVRKDNLRLTFPQGVMLFERVPPATFNVNGAATFGCFDNDILTAYPIQKIQ